MWMSRRARRKRGGVALVIVGFIARDARIKPPKSEEREAGGVTTRDGTQRRVKSHDKDNSSEMKPRISRTSGLRTRRAESRTSAGRSSYAGSRTRRLFICSPARRVDTQGGGRCSEPGAGSRDLRIGV